MTIMKTLLVSMILALLCTGCMSYDPDAMFRTAHRAQYLRQHPGLTLRIQEAIRTGQIVTDMTRLDVMAVWGPPASCSRTLGSPDMRTVCLYKDVRRTTILDSRYTDVTYKTALFEGDLLVDWQVH